MSDLVLLVDYRIHQLLISAVGKVLEMSKGSVDLWFRGQMIDHLKNRCICFGVIFFSQPYIRMSEDSMPSRLLLLGYLSKLFLCLYCTDHIFVC